MAIAPVRQRRQPVGNTSGPENPLVFCIPNLALNTTMKMPSCFSFIPLTLLLFSLPAFLALGQRSVDIALGLISDRNSFSDRIIAARTMTNEITAGDMPGILHFLKIAPEDLSPFSDSEVASLKNDVADSLFASRHFEYRILTTFEEILGDRSQGVVWR